MNQTLYIIAGIAGSGKSTYATKLATQVNGVIVSSDAIRGELCGGDETDQSKNNFIFNVIIPKRISSAIAEGKSVIFDATNVTRKARAGILILCRTGLNVECHYITPDAVKAKKQNKMRSRQVPEFVIDKHVNQWKEPTVEEGFNKVLNINEIR